MLAIKDRISRQFIVNGILSIKFHIAFKLMSEDFTDGKWNNGSSNGLLPGGIKPLPY